MLEGLRDRAAERTRTLPERHGGTWTLAALAIVVLAGFGLRVYFAKYEIDKPLPDSVGYTKIAASLYQDGHYGPPDLERRDTYSPGAPLFAAGVYYATGGVKPLLVRLIIAALGAATIVLAYLIGRRLAQPVLGPLAGPLAGVIGAVPVAIYPALLEYHGMLMTEPLGAFTLAAAVLAFLWAGERDGPWVWALPGFLIGLTALIRPEYLLFGVAFAILAAVRRRRDEGGWAPGLTGAAALLVAFAIPIVPWTVRNAVVLDRFVPISTGGGQALYIGQYLEAYEGGEGTVHSKILADLKRRHPDLEATTRRRYPDFSPEREIILGQALEVIAKRRYPDLAPDSGLTKLGREELTDNVTERPGKWAEVTLRKVWDMWKEGFNSGKHPAMSRPWWVVFHAALVLAALGGLLMVALQRRWEAWILGIPIAGITLIGAIFLASPRRVMILIPLLGALAGYAVMHAAGRPLRIHTRPVEGTQPSGSGEGTTPV